MSTLNFFIEVQESGFSKPLMPLGVEHELKLIGPGLVNISKPLMPLGVEHTNVTTTIMELKLSKPLMPLGVEHASISVIFAPRIFLNL